MQGNLLTVCDLQDHDPGEATTPSIALHGASGFTDAVFLDHDALATAGAGGVTIWDLNRPDSALTRASVTIPAAGLAIQQPRARFSPNSALLAVETESESSDDGTTMVLDGRSGKVVARFADVDLYKPTVLAWSADSASLTTVDYDGSGHIWSLDGSTPDTFPIATIRAVPKDLGFGQVSDAALRADGQLFRQDINGRVIASSATGGDPVVADPGDPTPSFPLVANGSADGHFFLHSRTGGIAIYDTEAKQSRTADIDGRATGIAFVDDSHAVVTRADGGSTLVELATGTTSTFAGIGGATYNAIAAAGETVASLGIDGHVTLTSLGSGASRGTVDLSQGLPVTPEFSTHTAVAVAPDGHAAAVVSADVGAVLLDLDPEDLVRTACASVSGSLTAAEWLSIVGTDPPADLNCH